MSRWQERCECGCPDCSCQRFTPLPCDRSIGEDVNDE